MSILAFPFVAIFDRVLHANWVSIVPYIALTCFIVAFAFIIFSALRMPRKDAERLSRLPLADEKKAQDEHTPQS